MLQRSLPQQLPDTVVHVRSFAFVAWRYLYCHEWRLWSQDFKVSAVTIRWRAFATAERYVLLWLVLSIELQQAHRAFVC
jgi:hypothetical protein